MQISAWQRRYIPKGLDAVIDAARIDNQSFVSLRYANYTSTSFGHPLRWAWPWNKVYMLFVFPLLLLGLASPRSSAVIWGATCTAKTTGYLGAHALIGPTQAIAPVLGVALPLSFAHVWWCRRAKPC